MSTQKRTRKIARELFDSLAGEVPGFYVSSRWKGRVMDWAMGNEAFKIQLFRFVDAIASLGSENELLKLFSEYFYSESPLLPASLKRFIPHRGVPAYIAGKLIKANVTSLAKQFIAGKTPDDALSEIKRIRKNGRAFSIDLLGEAVLSDKEAIIFEARYLNLIETLGNFVRGLKEDPLLDFNHEGAIPAGDISFKVSSFYPRLDPISRTDSIENTTAILKKIIKKADNSALSVTFDMEHYNLKDLTFDIFKSVLIEAPAVRFPAIALQAYLKSSEDDLRNLIKWARANKRPIGIRLVKGAYWDFERITNTLEGWPVPVFEGKAQTDSNFEKLTRVLLENTDIIRPAIASHNIRSISFAMAVAEEYGLEKNALEFQTLYGMAEPIKRSVASMGYRVRDYVPVGEFLPGMAYLVRRLLENTSNESFLKLSFVDKLDFDELMSEPDYKKDEGESTVEEKKKFSNSPLTDFADTSKTKDFENGVKLTLEKLATPMKIPLIIGNNGDESFTEETFSSFDPAKPDRVVANVSAATAKDVTRAVEEAKDAFKKCSRVAPEERAERLTDAAEWIEERRVEIAATQVFEVGKNWREADADVAEAIDFLRFYAQEIKRLGKPENLSSLPGELNYSHYIARGVVAVISPWNFPLAIATGMTAAALAAGNAVILKPSSLSPLTAFYIYQAFKETGLPGGVLQFLPGSGSIVGAGLVNDPGVDAVAFTGSMEVGLDIIKSAGVTKPGQQNVKKVIAEMGGKNAIIVDVSADLDDAIKGVVSSFTGFQGQKCSACSRVIVVRGVKDDFISRLTQTVASLKVGPPQDPANQVGPVINSAARKKINDYIETGKAEATLHYQYDNIPSTGFFVGPAIFTDVKPGARIAREEIFGPVLSVIEAKDIDEAIRIANDTRFALTGGIYSRSPENINKVKQELMTGNVYINRKITGALVERQPFGGFKMSGLGSKAGGTDYLLNFLFPRSISENTLRRGFAPEE